MDLPKLRPGLDFFPVDHEGERMIVLRDPMQVAPDPVVVPPHAFFILAHMDGGNTLEEIQAAFKRQFGQPVMGEQIRELIDTLDAKGFMESHAFQEKLGRIETAFRESTLRPSSLAGQSYPEEKEEVKRFLDTLFQDLDAPTERSSGTLAGIIAPHIDLQRGGPLFAKAYRSLSQGPPPKTALIFGTAHYGRGGPYILTVKDFETPLGLAEADRSFCEQLEKGLKTNIREGELAHRSEHSVEFQVLLLQHVLFGKPMPKIVTVLCGSVMEAPESGIDPMEIEGVAEFIDAARNTIEASEGPVLVIAGADLCHVGRKFGTREAISDAYLERVRSDDHRALEAAAATDADAFFAHVAGIGNSNNICSVTSIYTALKLLEPCTGTLLGYDMAVDREADSTVGFAALNFHTS